MKKFHIDLITSRNLLFFVTPICQFHPCCSDPSARGPVAIGPAGGPGAGGPGAGSQLLAQVLVLDAISQAVCPGSGGPGAGPGGPQARARSESGSFKKSPYIFP
jgi:hypothetical protein